MTIGILGTGRMALRLTTLFADQGHAVALELLALKLFDQERGNQR